MGANSNIEWTDHTFNPWIGCTKVSPGCANCYAAAQDNFRKWTPQGWGKGKPRRRTSAENWRGPMRWNAVQEWRADVLTPGMARVDYPLPRPRVFCASLADWLDDEVPIEWLADLLELIWQTPNLDWLLLTKRPQNWASRFTQLAQFRDVGSDQFLWEAKWYIHNTPPANVWIGTTVEDQPRADERIPHLLSIPARVRFLSCEPLLGPVDIEEHLEDQLDGGYALGSAPIHWVIAGGESGPGARPMHLDWALSLRDQCQRAGAAFFMKQMGGLRKPFPEIPDDLNVRDFPTVR